MWHANVLIFHTIVEHSLLNAQVFEYLIFHAHYPLRYITLVSADSRRERMKIWMPVIRRASNKSYIIDWIIEQKITTTFLLLDFFSSPIEFHGAGV